MSTSVDTKETDSMASTYDMGFGDSDSEGSMSTTDSYDANARDYWFGKKYFEYVIAQSILLRSPPDQDMAGLDASFEEVLRRFPHQEALGRCKMLEVSEEGFKLKQTMDLASRTLITNVGSVVRTSSHEQRALMIRTIREISEKLLKSLPLLNREPSSRLSVTAMADSLPVRDPGQYVSALQKYGAEHDFMPTYEYQLMNVSPPNYAAELICGDAHFQGIGRNKKVARHKAAYTACTHFGVMI